MPEGRDFYQVQPRYGPDRSFYDRIRAARSEYTLVEESIVPPYSGRAFPVDKGQSFRVIADQGPQIGTVALWNAHDPGECFNAMRTWVLGTLFVSTYSQLWSEVPWLRPLATCIADTVATSQHSHDHHWVGTHCNPETAEMRTGRPGLNSCYQNLVEAIEPLGLRDENIADSISVHQKVYLEPKRGMRVNLLRSEARRGDYIEFYAEVDLLVAVSVCPYGDGLSDEANGKGIVRPLGIQVYETGIQPREFPRLTDWRSAWKGRWTPPERGATRFAASPQGTHGEKGRGQDAC